MSLTLSIDDYSSYQSSVTTELASITSAEWASYTATATGASASAVISAMKASNDVAGGAQRPEVSLVGLGVLVLLVAWGLARDQM